MGAGSTDSFCGPMRVYPVFISSPQDIAAHVLQAFTDGVVFLNPLSFPTHYLCELLAQRQRPWRLTGERISWTWLALQRISFRNDVVNVGSIFSSDLWVGPMPGTG